MMNRCCSAPSAGPDVTAPSRNLCFHSLFSLFVSTIAASSGTRRAASCVSTTPLDPDTAFQSERGSCSAAPTIGEEMHDSTRHGLGPSRGLCAAPVRDRPHASVLLTDAFTMSASLCKFGRESEGPRGGVSRSIPLSRDVMLLSDVMLLRDVMLSET